jgi:hypothetical protein
MQPLTLIFLRKRDELVNPRRPIWLRVSFRVSKWPRGYLVRAQAPDQRSGFDQWLCIFASN